MLLKIKSNIKIMKFLKQQKLRSIIRISSLLLILISIMFFGCSQKLIRTIAYQSNEVTVDGKVAEYPSLQFYDSESKIMYNLSNTDSVLYVVLKVHDEAMQRKIMVAGLEISIDTAKKISNQFFIKYPLAGGRPPVQKNSGNEQVNERGNMGNKSQVEMMRTGFKLAKNEVNLRGFSGIPPGNQLLNSCQIKILVDWDSTGTMFYEAKIPLSTFYKSKIDLSDSSKIFAFSVNINALQAPGEQPGGGGQAGPPQGGGGMGGMNGGGQGGGQGRPGGSQPADMQTMSVKNNFTLKFKLHTKF